MEYQYVAITPESKVHRGTQTAANKDIAAKLLASQGYRVLTIRPLPAFFPRKEQFLRSAGNISPNIVILFSRQLALLLESGTDLVTALELLKLQATSKQMKNVLAEVIADLRKGERLSEALSKHPRVFSRMFVQTIAVGERTGGMDGMLRQIAEYMDSEAAAAKEVKNALRYPAFVGVVAIIVLAILTVYVLPAFSNLYQELGADVPAVTKMVYAMVAWFSKYGVYLLILVVSAVVAIYVYGRTPNGREQLDRITLKLPVIGRIAHLSELIRCCRSMSILHRSGLPVSDILGLVIEASNNTVIRNALTQVHQDVLKGRGLSGSMAGSEYFLPMMVQMVGVGEASGNLDITLMSTAESYETELADRMKSAIELIQPIITVVMALGVALIAAALFSAMYSIYGQLG
ncbi:MAG: type II secretion system F family protein [Chloroflexi bacterium]|nr:type II secretion system F family protein [Chloroflexota bacterium]